MGGVREVDCAEIHARVVMRLVYGRDQDPLLSISVICLIFFFVQLVSAYGYFTAYQGSVGFLNVVGSIYSGNLISKDLSSWSWVPSKWVPQRIR